MSSPLSGLSILLGLAVIAGVFFVLHRLRVRQRSLTVETTLFWRQALKETRARVFVQRFRHPWVYLLLVGISALLWLSFAGLDWSGGEHRHTLVLIDGSAGMGRSDRLERSLELAREYTADLPISDRTVIYCGGSARTVLRSGEHVRLLEERLRGVVAEACPANVEEVARVHLSRFSSDTGSDAGVRLVIVGDAAIDKAFVETLPSGVLIERLSLDDSAPSTNSGITALGASPAATGAWDKVDVLVEVTSLGSTIQKPALEIDGVARVEFVAESASTGPSSMSYVYRDLPANGEVLTVSIAGGGDLSLDDRAQMILPERRPLRVAIESGLPAVLTAVCDADPALAVATEKPDVVIRLSGSSFFAQVPAFELVDESELAQAFTIQFEAGQDPAKVISSLHTRLGLAEIDAAHVARSSGRVIAMGAIPGERRGMSIWSSLLSEEFNFVQSRAFPLFMALSVRWIAGDWTPPATLPTGVAVDLKGADLHDPAGSAVVALGDQLTLTQQGVYAVGTGQRVVASLLDPLSTAPSLATESATLAKAAPGSGGMDFTTLLLLLALALITFEWVMYQTGRMP